MNPREGDAYREFVDRSARGFLTLPDSAISLLSGIRFHQLGPCLFDAVRRGHERFGLPLDAVYDDIDARYLALQQGTVAGWMHYWVVRSIKGLAMVLRLIGTVAITVLWTSRKVRRRLAGAPPADPVRPAAGCRGAVDPPAISIVMLSCNRLVYLRNTIQALLETDDPSRHELIVVDNGSHDGSVEYLQRAHRSGVIAKLVLLRENLGISAGYNHGFAVADARSAHLMKLDSDIMIQSKDWLARGLEFLRGHPQIGFAALHQVNHPILLTLPVRRLDGWNVSDFGGWPCGSAMIMPRPVRAELGCFVEEPSMTYVPDDIDFYARVRRKGYQAAFLRDVVAYHQMNLDRTAYRSYNRSKALFESGLLALRLARDYDRGTRLLENCYPQYEVIPVPQNRLLATTDA